MMTGGSLGVRRKSRKSEQKVRTGQHMACKPLVNPRGTGLNAGRVGVKGTQPAMEGVMRQMGLVSQSAASRCQALAYRGDKEEGGGE